MISKRAAQKIWVQFREHLVNAERVLQDIITQELWKPLGHSSFGEAWDAQGLDNITFAPEIRRHIIYQMLAEGQSANDIAEAVKGVGPEQVKIAARKRSAGVPAGQAVLVRNHGRGRPSEPYRIIAEFDATARREYEQIAKHYGTTVKTIAEQAISERFANLAALEGQRV